MTVIHSQVFTMADVRVLTNLTVKTAEDWYRQGIIRASIRCGSRGTERLFDFADLSGAYLASSLRKAGFSLEIIRHAVDAFYSTTLGKGRYILAISGDDASIVTVDEVNQMLERGVPVSHVNLLQAGADLREEIDRQLEFVAQAEWN